MRYRTYILDAGRFSHSINRATLVGKIARQERRLVCADKEMKGLIEEFGEFMAPFSESLWKFLSNSMNGSRSEVLNFGFPVLLTSIKHENGLIFGEFVIPGNTNEITLDANTGRRHQTNSVADTEPSQG